MLNIHLSMVAIQSQCPCLKRYGTKTRRVDIYCSSVSSVYYMPFLTPGQDTSYSFLLGDYNHNIFIISLAI